MEDMMIKMATEKEAIKEEMKSQEKMMILQKQQMIEMEKELHEARMAKMKPKIKIFKPKQSKSNLRWC